MKEVNKKRLFYIILIFLMIFASGLIIRTLQNDTYYTIKIGNYIMENGIDMMDHFSFHNIPYTYPHWLYDVMIAVIYNIGSWFGIYISSIVLFMVLIYAVYKCTYKITDSLVSAFAATIICILAIANFITARAQTVSYIVFALEILFIEMYIKTKKKRYVVGLALLSLLLANMHVAVWPFFFVLFLPYIVEGIIAKFKIRNKTFMKLKNKFLVERIDLKPLFIIIAICLLMGLITPIKDTPYTYLIKTMMGNSQSYINEHQMITLKDAIFTIIIVIETIFLALFNKIKLRDLFLVLGTGLMSIISMRHISLLALIGSICFARTFSLYLDRFNYSVEEKLTKAMYKPALIIVAYSLVIVFSIFMFNYHSSEKYVDDTIYPVEASEWIKENLDYKNIRLFNDYNYGSYLLFNDIPVFIDSRADLYTKEFSGLDYDILDDYMLISEDNNPMEKYDVDYVITYGVASLHTDFLYNNKDYNMVYHDKLFVIYERLRGENNE